MTLCFICGKRVTESGGRVGQHRRRIGYYRYELCEASGNTWGSLLRQNELLAFLGKKPGDGNPYTFDPLEG